MTLVCAAAICGQVCLVPAALPDNRRYSFAVAFLLFPITSAQRKCGENSLRRLSVLRAEDWAGEFLELAEERGSMTISQGLSKGIVPDRGATQSIEQVLSPLGIGAADHPHYVAARVQTESARLAH